MTATGRGVSQKTAKKVGNFIKIQTEGGGKNSKNKQLSKVVTAKNTCRATMKTSSGFPNSSERRENKKKKGKEKARFGSSRGGTLNTLKLAGRDRKGK